MCRFKNNCTDENFKYRILLSQNSIINLQYCFCYFLEVVVNITKINFKKNSKNEHKRNESTHQFKHSLLIISKMYDLCNHFHFAFVL